MKRIYYSGVALLALSLLAATPATALSAHNPAESAAKTAAAVREELRGDVEQKRAEIQEMIAAKRAEVKEKLDQKRLEACEKHEAKINAIINKSVTQSKKHLAVFEKIEERVKAFYEDKNLNVENYDALLATVDEKHTAAAAQLDVAAETDFSCDDAEAARPTGQIKQLITDKNEAIKEYRTALKDLIVAIKGASTSTDKQSTESETEAN